MANIENFSMVTVHSVKKRMEFILTMLEESIDEAKKKGEFVKAFGCLHAVYTELKDMFTKLLDEPNLAVALKEVSELLDETEVYVLEHVAMTEDEIKQEYNDYIQETVKNHEKTPKIRMKLNKILADYPDTPTEVLLDFIIAESNNEFTEDMAMLLIDEIFDLTLINLLTGALDELRGDYDD